MSMETTTYLELDQRLRDFFQTKAVRDKCESLTEAVTDSSNLSKDLFEPNGIRFNARKWKEKVLLGLAQWYFPRELGCLINLYLEEHWGPEKLEMKELLLSSKELALGAILESDEWNDRDFFGNVLKQKVWKFFFRCKLLRRKTSEPERPQRRRGYSDKGFLRFPHESEHAFDYRKLLTVVELEERRGQRRQQINEFRRKVLLRLAKEGICA